RRRSRCPRRVRPRSGRGTRRWSCRNAPQLEAPFHEDLSELVRSDPRAVRRGLAYASPKLVAPRVALDELVPGGGEQLRRQRAPFDELETDDRGHHLDAPLVPVGRKRDALAES